MFRLAVWNMSHWQTERSGRTLQAWDALASLDADVALVQEARVPADLQLSAVGREIGGSRPWGSAVVGFTTPVSPVLAARGVASDRETDLQSLHGAVAVAQASIAGQSRTFISIYGMIENGYADTMVNRLLSDLVPVLDSSAHGGRIVLGGDLNITTQWIDDERRYRDWELATFARIAAFGLADCLDLTREIDGPWPECLCLDGEGCRHIHTQVHSNSPRPWYNDYVFASQELVVDGALVRSTVHREDKWLGFGGHFPVTVEFDWG